MHVENKHNCTGCGACYNICPQNAISMQGDKYGFYKPVIDNTKCVHCSLCEKVCPLDKNFTQDVEPKVFALINKDEKTRLKCASGGAFALFATQIINEGGVVYGVVWDENIIACHTRTDNLIDLEKMYSSKYVQSNIKNTFKQAKSDLEKGTQVLFSGTPCQIAGLKSYLKKEYENLITIDLVCHGAQSPLIFEKYKKEFMKDKKDEKLININFRSKIVKWSQCYLTTITTNKNIYNMKNDYYTKAMDLTLNTSCLSCKFIGKYRTADISIGDFWGVNEFDKSLNDNKGTSILLINNQKGYHILNKVLNCCLLKEVPYEAAVKRNPNIKRPSIENPKRIVFLDKICVNNRNIKKCAKKYLTPPIHIRLYRLLPLFAKDIIKYNILKMEK